MLAISSVDNAAKTVTLAEPLAAAVSGVDYAIYYAYPTSGGSRTAAGAIEHVSGPAAKGEFIGNQKETLRGIGPLLVDSPGYNLAEVRAQIQAILNTTTQAGVSAHRVIFADPRVTVLPT